MAGGSVLLVGAGLTSSLTASLLADSLPGLSVAVWEKARGAGGRFATSRAPSNPSCTVDLGAQYLSPSPEEARGSQYQALLSAGLLQPVDLSLVKGHRHGEGGKHFVAPKGASSLVKHFLQQSNADTSFGRRVAEILVTDTGRWQVKSECGHEAEFDAVVVTAPVPQILQLGGGVPARLQQQPQLLQQLEEVEYSTRFVLGMFFNEPVDLGVDWAASYIGDNPIVRFVSIDNLKRGLVGDEAPTSVLVHSTVSWGLKHKQLSLPEAEKLLVAAVVDLFPHWPKPKELKTLRWLYSQVHKSYPGSPCSVEVSQNPPLLLGGDAFAPSSNFSGCLQSALSLVEHLKSAF